MFTNSPDVVSTIVCCVADFAAVIVVAVAVVVPPSLGLLLSISFDFFSFLLIF